MPLCHLAFSGLLRGVREHRDRLCTSSHTVDFQQSRIYILRIRRRGRIRAGRLSRRNVRTRRRNRPSTEERLLRLIPSPA